MNQRRNRRGIALAWTAIVLIVMIGMVGLSIDWGKLTWNVSQMQNAADCGALAGAHTVKYNWHGVSDVNCVRQRARGIALMNIADGTQVSLDLNESNDPNGEIVIGRWIRQLKQFIPTMVAPNAVKVIVRRGGQRDDAPPLSMIWGPIFGKSDAEASRPAIAVSVASTGSGIICLAGDPSGLPGWQENKGTGLIPDGGTIIDLSGFDAVTGDPIVGDMQVNATSTAEPQEAFRINGTKVEITAGELNVCGSTNPDADDPGAWAAVYGNEPFSVNPKAPAVLDPLHAIVPPNIATMTTPTTATITGGTVTLDPGYYPGGINMSGGEVTLNPGVYAFGGGADGKSGLVVSGGSITGNGVMLYITGDEPGVKYAKIDIGGNAALNLVSRGDAMTPKEVNGEMGVVLWQDRANDNYAKVTGGGNCDMTGTIYVGYAGLELGGEFDQMGNQVIAGALDIHGSVRLGVGYDGRNTIKAQRSWLVK